jgi:hypothetical protein
MPAKQEHLPHWYKCPNSSRQCLYSTRMVKVKLQIRLAIKGWNRTKKKGRKLRTRKQRGQWNVGLALKPLPLQRHVPHLASPCLAQLVLPHLTRQIGEQRASLLRRWNGGERRNWRGNGVLAGFGFWRGSWTNGAESSRVCFCGISKMKNIISNFHCDWVPLVIKLLINRPVSGAWTDPNITGSPIFPTLYS